MHFFHVILGLLVAIFWGVTFVAAKLALTTIPPLLFAAERFFLASIPAVFFIKKPAVPFSMIFRYGIMMFTFPFALLLSGMYMGVTAGIASLLVQLQGAFTILLGIIFFGERLHKWQILGMCCAGLGLMLIGFNVGGSITWPGLMLVIGGAAAIALGNVVSKKIGKVDMLALVVWGSLVAWPPLLLMSFIFEGYDRIIHSVYMLGIVSIGAVCYVAYASTLFAFGAWSFLLHHYPISTVASFTLLVPVIGFLSSALILGEALQWWKIGALLLVGSGLAINIFGSRYLMKKTLFLKDQRG